MYFFFFYFILFFIFLYFFFFFFWVIIFSWKFQSRAKGYIVNDVIWVRNFCRDVLDQALEITVEDTKFNV